MKEQDKRSVPWKRILSLALVVVMVAGLLAVPALAATSKSMSGKNFSYFDVTTGKGLLYAWGLRKTTLSVRNTGKKAITVYEYSAAGWKYKKTVNPNQIGKIQISGNGKAVSYMVQGNQNSKASFTASVNAGSIR